MTFERLYFGRINIINDVRPRTRSSLSLHPNPLTSLHSWPCIYYWEFNISLKKGSTPIHQSMILIHIYAVPILKYTLYPPPPAVCHFQPVFCGEYSTDSCLLVYVACIKVSFVYTTYCCYCICVAFSHASYREHVARFNPASHSKDLPLCFLHWVSPYGNNLACWLFWTIL